MIELLGQNELFTYQKVSIPTGFVRDIQNRRREVKRKDSLCSIPRGNVVIKRV